MANDSKTDLPVTWIGHPMVSDNDPYTPSQVWMPGYLIGLRADGVVVWKKKESGPTAREDGGK